MSDQTAEIIAQLNAQMAALINAVPGLLALGPNTEQLVAMGKAMFQASAKIPGGPVQASYIQGIQQLAGAMKDNPTPASGSTPKIA